MAVFLNYLADQALAALYLLLAGVVAWTLIAMALQLLSNMFRDSFSGLFGVKPFVYLTAPGTVLHELSHAFFCLIFLHKVTDLRLFSPNGSELGHVTHNYDSANFYHRVGNFFIGTGPVWGGLFALYVTSRLLLPISMFVTDAGVWRGILCFFGGMLSLDFWCNWSSWLWFYLEFCFVSHMTLSKPDLKGALDGILVIAVLTLLLSLALGWIGDWTGWLLSKELLLLQVGVSTMLLPVIILAIFALLFHLILGCRSK